VWDYPRPPRLERISRRVVVEFGGVVVADSCRALRMLETSHPPTYYLPPEDVRTDLLVPSGRRGSYCEWKGAARYWHVRVDGREARDAAWSYPDPFDEYASLADHVAFYSAAMDVCRVGDLVATPQPGVKGEPGTEAW
jgi:uncharacterized protein (DUF427 family)